MTPADLDLGRRAVACRGFRWMPGMLTQHGERVIGVAHGAGCLLVVDVSGGDRTATETKIVRWDDGGPRVPDLSDPATSGCLLALVREAWGDRAVHAEACQFDACSGMWHVYRFVRGIEENIANGATEAEALVAALEAAP